ncbi:outer membrane beta-barrel protein [Rubrivirga sp.]|uniref:outer membrane beta-barrel protein n=1 Tax=Rubrivirga sp. TaxID=1885344 RepID=UPI003C75FFCC
MRLSLLALLVVSLPAFAQPAPDDRSEWDQTAKGVRLLGGGASITRFDENTSASLSPRIGVFVSDRLALSTSVQLGYSRSSFSSAIREESLSFSTLSAGLGPMVTYYLTDSSAARPFVEADVSLSYARSRQEAGALATGFPTAVTVSSNVSVGGGVAAGVELPIARNVALRGNAFYRTTDLTFDDGSLSFYGLSAGFSTFIY